jgi:MFS family permease
VGQLVGTPVGSQRRVWVVWSVALAAYVVGVMNRTSFGVAGLDAAQRFSATPAALSGFVVLQLLVYAALQVPVGLLLDRFGARALVTAGALTMAAGQVLLDRPRCPWRSPPGSWSARATR